MPRVPTYVASAVLALTAASALVVAAPGAGPATAAPDVDLFVGSDGTPPWFSGNTSPAAARPFGMVQLGPDTTVDGGPSAAASGYAWDDTRIRGFSPTHVSGAGCATLGDVPVLPLVGRVPEDPDSASLGFSHADESAAPGRYSVRLGNGVRVRLAADDRSGLATYRFPRSRRAVLLLKSGGSLAGVHRSRVRFPSRRSVAVSVTGRGFCGSPGRYRVHVLVRFDRDVRARGRIAGVGWVRFDTRRRPAVRAQVAVSFVDVAGARRNLSVDDPGWSHRALADEASAAWQAELGRIATTGGSLPEQQAFRAALYRVLLSPMTASDADGRYPGFDGRVHRVAPGHRHLTAVSGWDAYRTHLPLLAWLRPDIASDVVRSLHDAARQGGWLPKWPLLGHYTGIMGGDPSAPMAASAWAFGARDFDLGGLVDQLVRQADDTDPSPAQGFYVPRPRLSEYVERGYVTGRHGASLTLEYATVDFAVSRLAETAGRTADAERLLERSRSWRSLLHPDRRMLLPREESGEHVEPYDASSCCFHFEEGNAWQYQWSVPQDMAGALGAYGAREAVLERLAGFHRQLNAGAGRPYAWLGNQPSLSSPWAALWLRRPAHAAEVVARARRELWTPTPGGIPGNDDLGGLSAWYVWASLGLYPLTPGTATLGVTSPAFDSATVRPLVGPVTRISRTGSGAHVAGVTADGQARSQSWLAGPPATLRIDTSDDAESPWGTGPDDVPPSW